MKNVNVNVLDVFNIEDLKKEFSIEDKDVCKDDVVLEICVGCRGEIDDVKKVNVVDGFFKVNEESDISKIVLEECEEEDSEEYFLEFVCSEIYEIDNKKVWLEGWFEESNSYYERLK